MHDILGEKYHEYQGFFERASETSLYYGFQPIETPILEKEEVFTSATGTNTDIIEKEMYALKTKGGNRLAMRPEGTAGIVRAYIEHGMQTWHQPVMFYHYGPFFRHEKPQKGRLREFRQFGLEMLGTPKSIADVMVIRVMTIILEDVGFKGLCVHINSIGDKECRPAYVKELTAYYRKHINSLCVNCRQRIKTNPLRLLDCKHPQCQDKKEGAPDTISALCNACRQHFKEVLEYLEAVDIPYKIDSHLVRGLDYYTKTVFEIFDESEEDNKDDGEKESEVVPSTALAIASGGRYDDLARSLGSRRDVSAIGGSIGVDRILMSPHYRAVNPRIVKKPKVYFIQLGFEAKLKSLNIIEILRKAKIPVMHSLSKDSLSGQLAVAEKLKIPFTIIFGQKEALEGTVIIRNMNTRSQDTIKIGELADYIKKIK